MPFSKTLGIRFCGHSLKQTIDNIPTVFIFFGFRFLFYSNDHEPVHVHIVKDDCEAKYNVCPIEQVYNHGFKKQQIAIIESIIEENVEVIIDRWKLHFNK